MTAPEFVPARPTGLHCAFCPHPVVVAGSGAARHVMAHITYAHPAIASELEAMTPMERNHQTIASPFTLTSASR